MNLFIVLTFLILFWFGISDLRKKEISALHLAAGVSLTLILICICREKPAFYYVLALMPGIGMVVLSFLTREKLGYADGIVVMILGLLRGLLICLQSLMIGLLLLLCFFLALILLKKANRKTTLPFVPFLFLSWCLTETFQAAGGRTFYEM